MSTTSASLSLVHGRSIWAMLEVPFRALNDTHDIKFG